MDYKTVTYTKITTKMVRSYRRERRGRRIRIVKSGDIAVNVEEENDDEARRYSWERRRRRRMVKARDIAGNAEEECEAQRYSCERRRRRMVKPRGIPGNAEEE